MATSAEVKVGILTVSDSCYNGVAADRSGENLKNLVESGQMFHASVVTKDIVADEKAQIQTRLIHWSDHLKLDLILTTGGTGFAPRDVTPEATKAILEKEAIGMAVAMVKGSLDITPLAMLTRLVCGTRGRTLIINLPGSTKGSAECLQIVSAGIPHAIDLLRDHKAGIEQTHTALQDKKVKFSHDSSSSDSQVLLDSGQRCSNLDTGNPLMDPVSWVGARGDGQISPPLCEPQRCPGLTARPTKTFTSDLGVSQNSVAAAVFQLWKSLQVANTTTKAHFGGVTTDHVSQTLVKQSALALPTSVSDLASSNRADTVLSSQRSSIVVPLHNEVKRSSNVLDAVPSPALCSLARDFSCMPVAGPGNVESKQLVCTTSSLKPAVCTVSGLSWSDQQCYRVKGSCGCSRPNVHYHPQEDSYPVHDIRRPDTEPPIRITHCSRPDRVAVAMNTYRRNVSDQGHISPCNPTVTPSSSSCQSEVGSLTSEVSQAFTNKCPVLRWDNTPAHEQAKEHIQVTYPLSNQDNGGQHYTTTSTTQWHSEGCGRGEHERSDTFDMFHNSNFDQQSGVKCVVLKDKRESEDFTNVIMMTATTSSLDSSYSQCPTSMETSRLDYLSGTAGTLYEPIYNEGRLGTKSELKNSLSSANHIPCQPLPLSKKLTMGSGSAKSKVSFQVDKLWTAGNMAGGATGACQISSDFPSVVRSDKTDSLKQQLGHLAERGNVTVETMTAQLDLQSRRTNDHLNVGLEPPGQKSPDHNENQQEGVCDNSTPFEPETVDHDSSIVTDSSVWSSSLKHPKLSATAGCGGVMGVKAAKIHSPKTQGQLMYVPVGKAFCTFIRENPSIGGVYLHKGKREVKRQLVNLCRQDHPEDRVTSWRRGKEVLERNRFDDFFLLTPEGIAEQEMVHSGKKRDQYVVNWYIWCPGQGNCRRKCGGFGSCVSDCNGVLHKQDRHNCSLMINMKLLISDLSIWRVHLMGSHVPADCSIVWTPPLARDNRLTGLKSIRKSSAQPPGHHKDPIQHPETAGPVEDEPHSSCSDVCSETLAVGICAMSQPGQVTGLAPATIPSKKRISKMLSALKRRREQRPYHALRPSHKHVDSSRVGLDSEKPTVRETVPFTSQSVLTSEDGAGSDSLDINVEDDEHIAQEVTCGAVSSTTQNSSAHANTSVPDQKSELFNTVSLSVEQACRENNFLVPESQWEKQQVQVILDQENRQSQLVHEAAFSDEANSHGHLSSFGAPEPGGPHQPVHRIGAPEQGRPHQPVHHIGAPEQGRPHQPVHRIGAPEQGGPHQPVHRIGAPEQGGPHQPVHRIGAPEQGGPHQPVHHIGAPEQGGPHQPVHRIGAPEQGGPHQPVHHIGAPEQGGPHQPVHHIGAPEQGGPHQPVHHIGAPEQGGPHQPVHHIGAPEQGGPHQPVHRIGAPEQGGPHQPVHHIGAPEQGGPHQPVHRLGAPEQGGPHQPVHHIGAPGISEMAPCIPTAGTCDEDEQLLKEVASLCAQTMTANGGAYLDSLQCPSEDVDKHAIPSNSPQFEQPFLNENTLSDILNQASWSLHGSKGLPVSRHSSEFQSCAVSETSNVYNISASDMSCTRVEPSMPKSLCVRVSPGLHVTLASSAALCSHDLVSGVSLTQAHGALRVNYDGDLVTGGLPGTPGQDQHSSGSQVMRHSGPPSLSGPAAVLTYVQPNISVNIRDEVLPSYHEAAAELRSKQTNDSRMHDDC